MYSNLLLMPYYNFSIGRAIFQGSAAKIPNACMWVLGILIVLPRGCSGLDSMKMLLGCMTS